ncbi:EF-hand domain-containing protein [Actinosynnema pretiosum subsp. pretiosum]|uniref:EF-hand domain-containing protein n=2 Tax=Actinosynnema TaxID=40566 RepID=A0AA45L7K1_9PSEU|nr:EF-hand domain-containing protein [Actinosynnema mirum]ACU37721.1 putative signal transduction protein with EFhand domain [Actinosynnema mirum DSM 43827]AXX31151.1 calcium binding protein [Actinosynnema pretiosum subsp. pretiosum]QUF04776.1 EF-hand domain-containing protein [Actinosynnema pretiosum subsp. pretiosum]
MSTGIMQERLERRFDMWDSNHNGLNERSDYETEANNILRAFGEDASTPQGKALISSFTAMFEYFAEKAGVGPHGAMNKQQFMQVVEAEVFEGGDAGFSRAVRPTIQAIMNLIDTDGDGQINPVEFEKYLRVIGVDDMSAQEAFAQIDTDGNGMLSIDELVDAVRAYHFGTLDVPLLGR